MTFKGLRNCIVVPTGFKADMVQRFKVADVPVPGASAKSVVDIGIGFRDEITDPEYHPLDNEAVSFQHIPLAD